MSFADFNGIHHGWDLRDPQVDLRLSRRDCASSRLKRRPGIRSGVPDSRGAAALSTGSELAGLEEAGDQRDLALGFIFRNLCHFLLARRFQELPSIRVSGGPDLREKIAVAVTVEDQFSFGLRSGRDSGVRVDEPRRNCVFAVD